MFNKCQFLLSSLHCQCATAQSLPLYQLGFLQQHEWEVGIRNNGMVKDSKVHFLLSFQQRKNFTFFSKITPLYISMILPTFASSSILTTLFKSSFNLSSFILYIIDSYFVISILKYLYFIGSKISSLERRKKNATIKLG